MKRSNHGSTVETGDITFAAGYIIRYLEDYANSRAIPAQPFAFGVAELVRATTLGKVLGTEDHVSALRARGSAGDQTVESLAVHGSPHRRKTSVKRKLSAAGLRAIRKAQKARWAKLKSSGKTKSKKSRGVSAYWAGMTKEERSAEMKRRRALSLAA